MSWKQGPLSPDTYLWGGVVPKDLEGDGFYFADFKGDHVVIFPGERRLDADEVSWYNNSLDLPPCCTMRAKD